MAGEPVPDGLGREGRGGEGGARADGAVEDDGRGFAPEFRLRDRCPTGAERGLGLLGIRERAALLGGTVDVESGPGAGTTLFVRIPITPPDDGEALPDDTAAATAAAAAESVVP